jgi:Ni,Fe-hydrogenase III small subunit
MDATVLQADGACAAAGTASDATMIAGTQKFAGATALMRSGPTTSAQRERNERTSSEMARPHVASAHGSVAVIGCIEALQSGPNPR